MTSSVIILGAGFSIPAGIPQQNQILKSIFNIKLADLSHLDTAIPYDIELFKIFYQYFVKKDNYLEIPLEDIYTSIDKAIVRQRNIGVFDASLLLYIRESLDRLIGYVINREIKSSDIEKYKDKLSLFFDKKKKIKFISLNWDFLLEKVLREMNFKIDYEIPLKFTEDIKGKRIAVLKPHGSLNWKLCPICENIFAFFENEIWHCKKCHGIYSNEAPLMHELIKKRIIIKERLIPLLVTPTFLKSNFVPQLNLIMQIFYEYLIEADELHFIGYSLPLSDHDIRSVLLSAKSVNPHVNVSVILKSKNKTEIKRLQNNYLSIYPKNNIQFNFKGF